MLANRGYKQHIVIVGSHGWQSPKAALEAIEEWYLPVDASLAFGEKGFIPSQFTFATGWQTAYWVNHYQATKEKYYFIQDFEPYFYPVSTEFALAEDTYKLGMKAITAGSWLSKNWHVNMAWNASIYLSVMTRSYINPLLDKKIQSSEFYFIADTQRLAVCLDLGCWLWMSFAKNTVI